MRALLTCSCFNGEISERLVIEDLLSWPAYSYARPKSMGPRLVGEGGGGGGGGGGGCRRSKKGGGGERNVVVRPASTCNVISSILCEVRVQLVPAQHHRRYCHADTAGRAPTTGDNSFVTLH